MSSPHPKPRVLLVDLPAEVGPHFVNYPSFSAFGPLLVAAHLEQSGIEPTILEALTEKDPRCAPLLCTDEEGYRLLGWAPDPATVARHCRDTRTAWLVFSLGLFHRLTGAWGGAVQGLSAAAKRVHPTLRIVVADCHVGGQDYIPIDVDRLFALQPDVDYYVRGESEHALTALIHSVSPHSEPADKSFAIDGVWTRSSRRNPGFGPPLAMVDHWPCPAFHRIDLVRFTAAQKQLVRADFLPEYHGTKTPLPAQTSRGCPYRCLFCAGLPVRPYRCATPKQIAALIERYTAWVEPDDLVVCFLDDLINPSAKRFKAIERILAQHGISWTAVNGLRADHLDREAVAKYAPSGGFNLKISPEAADPHILNAVIEKRMNPRAVEDVARFAAACNVDCMAHYMVGLPEEGVAEMNRTLWLAADLYERYGVHPRLQFATPVPGSRFSRRCLAEGLLSAELRRDRLGEFFHGGGCLDLPTLPRRVQNGAVALLRRRLNRQRDPTLLLDPHYDCNQRCRYCCVDHLRKKRLTADQIVNTTQNARARGVERVDVGGGEPTLDEDLPSFIEDLRRSGFVDIGLVTNGRRLCYDSYLSRLIAAGVRRFLVSVAAHDESLNAAVTRTPGALAQTLAGLENLSDRTGAITWSLNLTVCRSNVMFLPEMVRFYCEHHPPTALDIQIVMPLGAAADSPELLACYEDVVSPLREALTVCPDLHIHNLPPCFLPDHPAAVLAESDKSDRLQVDPDGNVVSFAAVLAHALTRQPYCVTCPAAIACAGMQKHLAARYRDQPERSDRMVALFESTDIARLIETPDLIETPEAIDKGENR